MRKLVFMCAAGVMSSALASAQMSEQSLREKYKGENAVYTEFTQRMVIKYDDGKLTAKSYVDKEILLLTDMAPKLYNQSTVYHSFFHKLDDLEGQTLLPDDKKGYRSIKALDYKTSHSESENVFYDDAKQTVVTYGSLVKNAKTRVSYSIEHPDIHFMPSFYFQSYLPIAHASFSVTAPKWVNLKYVLKGNFKDKVKYTTDESKNTVTYTWTADDVPRLQSYENAPGAEYYMLHALVFVTDYTAPKDGKKTPVLGSVDDLYHFYYPFIKDINKVEDATLMNTVNSVTRDVTDPKAKARKIYQWVQQNIKYVAFENGMGGFVPREASLVCSRKFGDCKDMSSLLVTMCRKAGIDAYFTWIGTRDKPYTYEETPIPVVDNHMICTIKIGDEWIFMDGTDPTIPFGNPPYAIQGKQALVGLDKDHYKIIKVPRMDAAKNTVVDSTHISLADNNLKGSVKIDYKGYPAWYMNAMFMYKNDNERSKTLRDYTTRGNNKYIQKSSDYKIDSSFAKNVSLMSEFELPDYAQNIGKEWIVNMNLNRRLQNDVLDLKDRKVDIEYDYMQNIREVVVLDIPKGYHVSYMPPNAEQKVNDLWGYKISYTQKGNQVFYEREFSINTLYAHPEQFSAHVKLIDDLKKQYKESIVLTADK